MIRRLEIDGWRLLPKSEPDIHSYEFQIECPVCKAGSYLLKKCYRLNTIVLLASPEIVSENQKPVFEVQIRAIQEEDSRELWAISNHTAIFAEIIEYLASLYKNDNNEVIYFTVDDELIAELAARHGQLDSKNNMYFNPKKVSYVNINHRLS